MLVLTSLETLVYLEISNMSYTVIKSVVVRILNNVTNEKLTVSNTEWDATLATCTNPQTAANKLFQKHIEVPCERGSGRIELPIN